VTARVVVFGLGLVGAVGLAFYAEARGVGWLGVLVLACCPLMVLSLPAGLLMWATIRHGGPYNI
jgi:hypothetical protein